MSQDNIKRFSSKSSIRNHSQSAFTTSLRERPVVHNAQHIDDINRKHSIDFSERRNCQLDECSLQMTNDPNSIFYRRLSQTLEKHPSNPSFSIEEETEKLKLFQQYGTNLVEYVKDKDGHLKSKFDKVFIT